MSEPVVRQRSRPEPEVNHAETSRLKWPNGSQVYSDGGVASLEKQIGWIVRKGASVWEAHRRTGPKDSDSVLVGDAPEFSLALTKLGGKTWA